MENLKTWFKGLSEREQKMVLAASVVAVVGIFYFAIYNPLTTAIEDQKNAVASDKELLVWVQEQSSRAKVLRQSASQTRYTGSLTQVVNQTTRSANIPVARMQPQGDELIVFIDQVAFNDYIQWLSTLEGRGVIILQSDVSEVDTQGFVQVRRLLIGK
jgi:general secretion pathway protein M